MSQEKIDNNAYAKFWGANKVYYGQCGNGEWQRKLASQSTLVVKTTSSPSFQA